MRRAWKIALPVTCAVLIGGAMTFELVHRHHMEQQKLAQQAQAYWVRAEQGDAEAEYRLAWIYNKGQGVPKSYTEAFRWYRKAADQKLAEAQYDVGYSYYYGYGVDGDFTEALRWFHLAADQKLPAAENQIGIAYEVGNGVASNPGEAVRWYRLSADQGYAAAQYNLGRLYAYGYGVGQDRVEARKWITRAADQDYPHAKQMLGRSWPAISTCQKIELLGALAAGIFFLFASRDPRQEPGSRIRRTTRFVGLGLVFSAALGLLSFTYVGILQPPLLVGALGFARNFVWGSLACILLPIVWHNSAKWALWASAVLFIAINGVVLAICFNRLKTEAAIRLLVSVNGSPLGLGITSAVLLLRAKRGGETSAPSGISSGIVT